MDYMLSRAFSYGKPGMLLCVSLNPAIDRRLQMSRLLVGSVNRTCKADAAPGGKATHVAMVLQTLGAAPRWLGFAAGATGAMLIEGLRQMGIDAHAVPVQGETRTNLELLEADGRVTEILEPGPEICPEELARFQSAYETLVGSAVTAVILSGSLPPGVPSDYYAILIRAARKLRARVFLDTSGEPLRSALLAEPYFVKPNREEAESWSGSIIDGVNSARTVLDHMLQSGASSGAISLGADGLVWSSREQAGALVARVPKLSSGSCVGSGDATLAGFAFAAERACNAEDSVRLAAACGLANCLADGPGRASASDIERLKHEISLEILP